MKIEGKIFRIFLEAIPIILMILFIPFIKNDYFLTGVFVIVITGSFLAKYEKRDLFFLLFGLIVMTIAEYSFVLTGVETFNRASLLGIMPLWLPVLWAYAFVAIKRAIQIIK